MPRYKIKYFSPERQIKPNTVFMFLGRRGMGKTTTMCSILRELPFRFHAVVAMSPTRSSCDEFERMGIPKSLIYDDLDPTIIDRVLHAATVLTNKGRKIKIALILDDCTYDKSLWKGGGNAGTAFRKLLMNGRHLGITVLMTAQYCMDIPMHLRNSIDYVFAHRENIKAIKKRLHLFFFGLVENSKDFNALMQKCTQNRETLVLDNTQIQSSEVEDNMFVYKATVYDHRIDNIVAPAISMMHRRFFDCSPKEHTRTVALK